MVYRTMLLNVGKWARMGRCLQEEGTLRSSTLKVPPLLLDTHLLISNKLLAYFSVVQTLQSANNELSKVVHFY